MQVSLLQLAGDPFAAMQLLLKIEVLVRIRQIYTLGCLFAKRGYLVLHFYDNFAHLQICPFPVFSVHVDFCDQTHELVGEIDI